MFISYKALSTAFGASGLNGHRVLQHVAEELKRNNDRKLLKQLTGAQTVLEIQKT